MDIGGEGGEDERVEFVGVLVGTGIKTGAGEERREEDMTCTWENCELEATHEEIDRDGRVWSKLCPFHHVELLNSLEDDPPYRLLATWVKAQGGAKKAAGRLML